MNIFGKPEPLAAIHAAKTYRTSAEEHFDRPAAFPAFQVSIVHAVDLLYPIHAFFKTPYLRTLPFAGQDTLYYAYIMTGVRLTGSSDTERVGCTC